ncbi:acetyltransferase [Aliikangiella coralliicola]|uniref:Acetyltransferase n=1 Tax=Aliikangiella coralliicola TaxID=2592383 RepID=A0A545UIH4_9GAMM|nr:acetyltransferase [Aliikangiella coralliicola]TQV89260.1 acetyltransferase [Aliikangiella coralliicola]
MLLKEKSSGNLVEVLYLSELFSLYEEELQGRYQVGDEVLVTESFKKSDLAFSSGEELPKCWTDPQYRAKELEL